MCDHFETEVHCCGSIPFGRWQRLEGPEGTGNWGCAEKCKESGVRACFRFKYTTITDHGHLREGLGRTDRSMFPEASKGELERL